MFETNPRTWLMLVAGLADFNAAVAAGLVAVSGPRAAEIGRHLPLPT